MNSSSPTVSHCELVSLLMPPPSLPSPAGARLAGRAPALGLAARRRAPLRLPSLLLRRHGARNAAGDAGRSGGRCGGDAACEMRRRCGERDSLQARPPCRCLPRRCSASGRSSSSTATSPTPSRRARGWGGGRGGEGAVAHFTASLKRGGPSTLLPFGQALQHYESRVPLHTLLERAHALYAADHPQLYAPPAAPPPRPPPPPDRMSSNGAAYL